MEQQIHLQCNNLEPTLRPVPVKIALYIVCVCFTWLFDADGDLALIDPRELVLERERERERKRKRKRGELGQDSKEGCKENLRLTLKPVALVPSPSLPSRY